MAEIIHNVKIDKLSSLSPFSAGIVETSDPDDPVWKEICKNEKLQKLLGAKIESKWQQPRPLTKMCHKLITNYNTRSNHYLEYITCSKTDDPTLHKARDILDN
ncbi:138_t:CDS:1, partial [Paraglomus occultum]